MTRRWISCVNPHLALHATVLGASHVRFQGYEHETVAAQTLLSRVLEGRPLVRKFAKHLDVGHHAGQYLPR